MGSSSIALNIEEALKQTKCRKCSNKFDLALVDFNSIDVCEVRYLPSSFDGNVIFVLPSLACGAPTTYACGMDGINNVYDGHAWVYY